MDPNLFVMILARGFQFCNQTHGTKHTKDNQTGTRETHLMTCYEYLAHVEFGNKSYKGSETRENVMTIVDLQPGNGE